MPYQPKTSSKSIYRRLSDVLDGVDWDLVHARDKVAIVRLVANEVFGGDETAEMIREAMEPYLELGCGNLEVPREL